MCLPTIICVAVEAFGLSYHNRSIYQIVVEFLNYGSLVLRFKANGRTLSFVAFLSTWPL